MPIDRAVAFFTGPRSATRATRSSTRAACVLGLAPRAEVMRWLTEGPHEGQTLGEVVSDAGLLRGAPDEAVGALVEQMVERDVGRVPIVDEAGRLVGLVTRKDLLRVHARQRELEIERAATPPVWRRSEVRAN